MARARIVSTKSRRFEYSAQHATDSIPKHQPRLFWFSLALRSKDSKLDSLVKSLRRSN